MDTTLTIISTDSFTAGTIINIARTVGLYAQPATPAKHSGCVRPLSINVSTPLRARTSVVVTRTATLAVSAA